MGNVFKHIICSFLRPVVNQEVNVIVKASQAMQYFVYQIVGRGDILMSRSVDVSFLYKKFPLVKNRNRTMF